MPNRVTGDDFWFEKYPRIPRYGFTALTTVDQPWMYSGYSHVAFWDGDDDY